MEELFLLQQDLKFFADHTLWQRDHWAALSQEERCPALRHYAELRAAQLLKFSSEATQVKGGLDELLANRPVIQAHLAQVSASLH